MSVDLHRAVSDFYYNYAAILDQRLTEQWVASFHEEGLYTLTTHANATGKGLYLAYEAGRAALTRRAASVTTGYLKAQRNKTLHVISNIRVLDVHDQTCTANAYFVMFRTARDQTSRLHVCGTFDDRLSMVDDKLILLQHNVVVDAENLPANMVDLF